MYFAAYLAVALAFALAFAGLIKKAPWPFYLVALVLSALYAYCWYSGLPRPWLSLSLSVTATDQDAD